MPGPFVPSRMATMRRSGTAAAPAPSFSEGVAASFRNARDDIEGSTDRKVIEAYRPIIEQLAASGRPALRYTASSRYAFADVEARIWSDIAAARQRNPAAFAGVPVDRDTFRRDTVARISEQARRDTEVSGRAGLSAQLIGGFGGTMMDPVNAATMAGGLAANTLRRAIVAGAVENAGIEMVQTPAIARERATTGRAYSDEEKAANIVMGGLFGGVANGAIHVAPGALRGVWNRLPEGVRQRWKSADDVTDADLADIAEATIGAGRMTEAEAQAVRAVRREAEITATSPFQPGAGTAEHIARVEQRVADLRTGATPAPASGARLPRRDLTLDSIISNTFKLEGGAAVVRYSRADGGTTKYGIAAKFNPGVDVANLTEAQARDITRRKYWYRELDLIDPRAAAVVFDAGFVAGPKTGRRILRESGGDADRALELYRAHLNRIADTVPGKARYRKGWNRRVDGMARFVGEGDGAPKLRRDIFAEGEDGDAAWQIAQRGLEDAQAADRAARADLDAMEADEIPFDLDDPRTTAPAERDSDPFAYLDEDLPSASPRDAADPSDGDAIVGTRSDEAPLERMAPDEDDIASGAEGAARETDEALPSDAPDYVAPHLMPETAAGVPQERFLPDDQSPAAATMRTAWRDDMAAGRAPQPMYVIRPIAGGDAAVATPSWSIARRTEADPPGVGPHEIVRIHPPDTPDGLEPARAEVLAAFDAIDGEGVERQIDSLEHDLRMFLQEDEAKGLTVRLTEEGDAVNAADLMEEFDAFDADIEAARACMMVPGGDA